MYWPRLSDAVKFLRTYGHKETLDAWTDNDLYSAFLEPGRPFAWCRDRDGELSGIVLATIKGDTLHVDTIAMRGESIKTFVTKFRREYPGYKLTGYRKGKLKRFKKYEQSS